MFFHSFLLLVCWQQEVWCGLLCVYGNVTFILSEKPFTELKSKAEEKAKMYYLSCMDANETIETLGAKPMLNLLKRVGGWNISAVGGKPFNVSTWELQTTIHTLQNGYNMGGLFSWAVGEDDRNSTRHVIQVRIYSTALIKQNSSWRIQVLCDMTHCQWVIGTWCSIKTLEITQKTQHHIPEQLHPLKQNLRPHKSSFHSQGLTFPLCVNIM